VFPLKARARLTFGTAAGFPSGQQRGRHGRCTNLTISSPLLRGSSRLLSGSAISSGPVLTVELVLDPFVIPGQAAALMGQHSIAKSFNLVACNVVEGALW
jgi:hypothetical protein